ncbi:MULTISPECIES: hypothetical protein [Streptomycetaceae]|uniref:Uncharacterized protein n=1 Tax=Streptantibioticus cattleyicolor (strain ATCC 35852 / DSM 46488 / JCM 4925 / NBRC 14057 / NRRL 8057) TaxID=1003195 RepID=F8K2R1_STREN|nr:MULTISPECIES: hypothetical protein [Streptomycetaceae]AEW97575.1 hypothetical protein SCATT_52040 [Streptantibioticus cattleyicolor NRRL 8057 = DSM 46488]MYS62007.1 hypothetical protein [Streptomyces sp. SID5468]CCB77900.1 protein of unknown function [Streptantibioticus cattleyicolor NRRL 8057 = DSM 46488]
MATALGVGPALGPAPSVSPAGAELLVVVGPAGPARTALLHALGGTGAHRVEAPQRPGPCWAALRALADTGTPVVAACDGTDPAMDAVAHRVVLLPVADGLGAGQYG